MPNAAPESRFDAFDCSGVLNEWIEPTMVGGKGLTACNNLIYHRQGGWGRRPGALRNGLLNGPQNTAVSGFRWYRVYPNILTQLFVWQQGQLLVGNNDHSLAAVPNGPSGKMSLTNSAVSPDFCSSRDPQAAQGNGADICIMTGITLDKGSFGTGDVTVSGLPAQDISADVKIYLTVSDGVHTVTTDAYQILPTDNPASIAQQLVTLINSSAAYLAKGSFPPFLGVTYYTQANQGPGGAAPTASQPANIHLGARAGGPAGNTITFGVVWTGTNLGTGATLAVNLNGSIPVPFPSPLPGVTTNFTGGGNPWSGPVRYESGAGVLEGLSYMAPNAFTGCCTWHDHVWFWGDPNNPDTVFASDIFQPEAFTFMAINGGMNPKPASGNITGGYNIGPGDGDPGVQTCIPNGNSLYIFKTATIYQVMGYDFQQGEYQFSVAPQVVGYGVPSRDCVDVLEGQFIFWSGKKFLRLAVGAYEPEHIGMPVALHEGLASGGNQAIVKVVAGDFLVQTILTDTYATTLGNAPPQQPILLRSVALFAVDIGDGSADTIMVYDDEKTAINKEYAWSIWTGWNIGCWIKYGAGVSPDGKQDRPLLFFVDPPGQFIYQAGKSPTADWGNPIPWMAQTGWIDFGTPELIKNIHEFYLRVEATAGASFVCYNIPARIVPPVPQQSQFPAAPITFAFGPTLAPAQCEALNDLKSFIQAALRCEALIVQFTEDGTSFAGFELLSYGIDANPQEAYQT